MSEQGYDQPRPIEELSEQELRQEVLDGINQTLGSKAYGPVADGTGAFGYNRDESTYLTCSYVRFLKVMGQRDEGAKGVQLELLGLFNGYTKAMQEKDGFPPSSIGNRYYIIPSDPEQPVVVSVEDFVQRAYRANPEVAGTVFRELLSQVQNEQEQGTTSREATLQDLRDAAKIVRGYKSFVAEIISDTPPEFWGRPGLTE